MKWSVRFEVVGFVYCCLVLREIFGAFREAYCWLFFYLRVERNSIEISCGLRFDFLEIGSWPH